MANQPRNQLNFGKHLNCGKSRDVPLSATQSKDLPVNYTQVGTRSNMHPHNTQKPSDKTCTHIRYTTGGNAVAYISPRHNPTTSLILPFRNKRG